MLQTLKMTNFDFSVNKNLIVNVAFGLLAFALIASIAHAGTSSTGTEFDPIWTTLTDWTTGTLGKIIAGSIVLIGIIAGVTKQSLMAFAVGIAGGMGLYNAPTIIDNVFSATINNIDTLTQAGVILSNGL